MYDEERIQQLRLQEATNKEYVGQTSKFIYIAKLLGTEIIQDNFVDDSVDSLYNFDIATNEEILTFSEDHTSTILGYSFDSLRSGIPLEIIYKDGANSIKVFWKNRLVFEETYGVLERYVPLQEWETKIEEFYIKAMQKLKVIRENQQNTQKKVSPEDARELQKMREKWGVS